MKRISNKIALTSSIISTACLVLAPVGAYAVGRPAVAAPGSPKVNTAFCNGITNQASAVTGRVSGLNDKVTQAWSQQDQKLAAQFQKVDQEVAADRQKADSETQADFSKLEAKATTDAEKQAVKAYETAVLNAISTRRADYDAARQVFRTGVQNAISTRRSTVSSQITDFQNAINSAFTTAEASCSSGSADGTTIHQALQSSLKTARETYQDDRKTDGTVGSQVKQLVIARQAAFKAADTAFQDSLTSARTTLKQAFGGSGNSI